MFVVGLIAAACGGDDDDASGDDGSAETTEDTASDDAGSDDGSDGGSDDADAGSDDGDDGEEPADGEAPVEDEERTASDVGITEDTIKIGLVISDLEGLRDIGFPLPEALTNDHLLDRYRKTFDRWNEAGGINGRMIETVDLTWDPLDPATMENACTRGTLDEQIFMAVNASGFSATFVPCFAVDNDTTFLFGEVISQSIIDQAPERIFSLNPTSEVVAELGAQLAIDQGLVPEGTKVGILSSAGNPSINAAGQRTLEVVEAAGFETVLIEANTVTDDNAALNAETAAAVGTFSAEGVGHAFMLLPFTNAAGFWTEVEATDPDWDVTIIDAASSNCTPFGASRTPASAAGSVCVTAYSSYLNPDNTFRDETEFEAACREQWKQDFAEEFAGSSDPGVPSGDIIETVDGETLYSDYAPGECTLLPALEHAFTNAGVNPTRDSFAEALRTYSGPNAFNSNGEGTFGPEKNFFATQLWAVEFRLADAETPRGEDGTFNGCPAPTNCWVPVTGEWQAIES